MTQFKVLTVGKRYKVRVITEDINMIFVGRLQAKIDMSQQLYKRLVFDCADIAISDNTRSTFTFEEVT